MHVEYVYSQTTDNKITTLFNFIGSWRGTDKTDSVSV